MFQRFLSFLCLLQSEPEISNSLLACHEIYHLFWNLKVLCHLHKRPCNEPDKTFKASTQHIHIRKLAIKINKMKNECSTPLEKVHTRFSPINCRVCIMKHIRNVSIT
jgi:hypothetical protein